MGDLDNRRLIKLFIAIVTHYYISKGQNSDLCSNMVVFEEREAVRALG